ncbi:MAG TPA: hypothetical protein VGE98_01085 [Thermoanaerobaculia bacterium]
MREIAAGDRAVPAQMATSARAIGIARLTVLGTLPVYAAKLRLAVGATLAAAAFVVCLSPALAAARTDPAKVLRQG